MTPAEKRARARELDREAEGLIRHAAELRATAGCLLIEADAEDGGKGNCQCLDGGHRSSEGSMYCLCGGMMA